MENKRKGTLAFFDDFVREKKHVMESKSHLFSIPEVKENKEEEDSEKYVSKMDTSEKYVYLKCFFTL